MRHPKFFFDNVLVAIEGTLFNIHKYQLEKSKVFSDMFSIPKPESREAEEGSSPEHPIVIGGIAASDFATLMTVLYASLFSSNQPSPEASLVIPAFRLANIFNFSELPAYLLPLAEEKLADVDKIVFARVSRFNIKEWLTPAHLQLCKRDEVLSTEETRKLGVDSVLLVSQMQEKYRSRSSATRDGYYCNGCVARNVSANNQTCINCGRHQLNSFFSFGTIMKGTQANTQDSALEEEVDKWVEAGRIAKYS